MPAVDNLGPLAAHALLIARDPSPQTSGQDRINPGAGVIDPHGINNTAIFVLFGLIGAALVVTGIWFFFWARNGGFHFKENDWDDYKTTVLRRKGPNGTVLSNATPSTNLGGGSIYKDVDDGKTTVTDSTGLSGITAGVSDIAGRERRKRKMEQKEREKQRRKERSKARRHVGEDGALIDEVAEREAKEQLRSYRHERPARVGGINKESDASTWDASTNPTESTASSDLLSNRQATPTNTPTKSGGIRKVYSAADRREEREEARIRAEARRLAERGRAAAAASSPISSPSRTERRDFSYQRAESSNAESALIRSGGNVPGSWAASDNGESELGTKSYRHPIPELRSQSSHSHGHSHSQSLTHAHGHHRSQSRSSTHRDSHRDSQALSRRTSSRRRSRSGYRRGRSDSIDEY